MADANYVADATGDRWSEFDEWHVLFDELCNRSGDYDNARLGSEYCNRMGKHGEMHFETAIRNLRNWRSGKHIPRQRNFMILSQLLGVAGEPSLQDRWNVLYARAREVDGAAPSASPDEPDRLPADTPSALPVPSTSRIVDPVTRRFDRRTVVFGLILFCCGVLASELYRAEPWRWVQSIDKAPLIVWRPHVSLLVGESLVIHGERGDCGKPPPDWEYVLTRLPISRIGDFTDGGIVRRNSNFCRGETPARAVTFTARKPGVEELLVLGDIMRVSVSAVD
ncbi:MAG: hypothetical protein KDJ87_06655 [Rhizobiaceae bacterium]|nr:hypothetical protein [Rhizobiaceae bacterium]